MKIKLNRNIKYSLYFFFIIFFAALAGQRLPYGYLHPADPFVMMAAVVLPAPYAIIVSIAASVAVDLIKGYYWLAITTAVVKLLMILAVKALLKLPAAKKFPDLLAAPAALIPIPFYFLGITIEQWVYLQKPLAAMAEALRNLSKDLIQGLIGVILFIVLYAVYKKLKERRARKRALKAQQPSEE